MFYISNIEAVHFRIKIVDSCYNFISAYKPPSLNDALFLDDLGQFIETLDTSMSLFIIGDLNMDLKSSKGIPLSLFMQDFSLKNFVNQFTRSVKNWNIKKNKFITSRSLIDVILHNGSLISDTKTIDCPFSDHKLVVASLKLNPAKVVVTKRKIRNLNTLNITKIISNLGSLDLFFDFNGFSIENIWNYLKNTIINLTNKFAPLKNIEIKYRSQFPWSDKGQFPWP